MCEIEEEEATEEEEEEEEKEAAGCGAKNKTPHNDGEQFPQLKDGITPCVAICVRKAVVKEERKEEICIMSVVKVKGER